MAVILAMILDAMLGEPKWLWSRVPHPAVVMGRMIADLDARWNNDTRQAGVMAVLTLLAGAFALGAFLIILPGVWAEVIVGAILLAQKSLVQHVQQVADAVRISLGDGRRAVAMIVGRDVRDMSRHDIARGAIESAAENFSDGVIAPLFWFALCGLPGLLAYKIINTADSMIGYRTDTYENFGWAAAKLDDVLNWVPARITAALIWVVAPNRARWGAIAQDAALHRSPNAGWPESAMAPALGVSVSGPRSYDGTVQNFPWVYPDGRKDAGPRDIDGAVAILWRAWAAAFVCAVVIALL